MSSIPSNLLDIYILSKGFIGTSILATLTITLYPKLFGIRAFSGIFFAQYTLIINTLPIVSGFHTDSLSLERVLFFIGIEFGYLTAIILIYKGILKKRLFYLHTLERFYKGKYGTFLILFFIALAVFNWINVPTDGASRIGFMTSRWYSLIKPAIEIVTPAGYLGIFLLMRHKKHRAQGIFLLLAVIASSIFSGSKAGFITSLGSAFLLTSDLKRRFDTVLKNRTKIIIGTLAVSLMFVAFSRLETTPAHLFRRFFLTADATIMVYFSDNPTEAGENVSMFAKMHRGFARLAGDKSAQNIDTLFGYALNKIRLGKNTFTGPNARIGAYFLCNFQNLTIIFGLITVVTYLLLTKSSLICTAHNTWLTALIFPFVIKSLGITSQDFNVLMMFITYSILITAIGMTSLSLTRIKRLERERSTNLQTSNLPRFRQYPHASLEKTTEKTP